MKVLSTRTKKSRKSKFSVLARSFVPIVIFIVVISLLMIVVKADEPNPPAYNISSVYPSLPSEFNGGADDSDSLYHNSKVWLPAESLYPSDTYKYFARVISGVQKTSVNRGFPRQSGVSGYTTDVANIEKLFYWDWINSDYQIPRAVFEQLLFGYKDTLGRELPSGSFTIPLGQGTLAMSRIVNDSNIRGVYNGTFACNVMVQYPTSETLSNNPDAPINIYLQFRMDYNGINSYMYFQMHFSAPHSQQDFFTQGASGNVLRFGSDVYSFGDIQRIYFLFGDTTNEDTVIPSSGLELFYPLFRAMRSTTAFYTYPRFYYSSYSNGFTDGQSAGEWTESVAYQSGYNAGYNDGFANPASNSIAKLIKEVIEAPFYIIAHGFNVDFMGINFANMIFFIISVAVGWFVIKLVTHLLL